MSRGRRILYVSDALSVHTRRWAEAFRDMGADVHVASFRPAEIAGVTVHVLPTAGLGKAGYLLAVPRLRRLFTRLRPDVVHAQYVTSYGFVAALARLRPLILTAWGTDVLISPRESRLSRWLAQRALLAADEVTTVAEHMNAAVLALGAPASKVQAIPFGVDTALFCPPDSPRLTTPPLRVISTRNFAPVYDVHTVVDAVRAVHAQGLDVHLDLVGDGPLRPELESQVSAAGLQGRVTFHGHVNHIRLVELLGTSHVFVSSAVSDGNNVSLNEAMACGCFPLATDIAANSQWISDGRNGGLFQLRASEELAQWIQRAAAEPSLRAAAAVDNRRIVEERAEWRLGVYRMNALYERVAASRKVKP
jgi:glycosyltransferase involved in cell wall biosynthesis